MMLAVLAAMLLQVDQTPTVGVANPAVTDANLAQTICEVPPIHKPAGWKGWIERQRPPASYTTKLKREQLPPGTNLSLFEEDHGWPIETGGNPRDPRNLRPQAWNGPSGAKAKDQVENAVHRAICAHTMTLAQGHEVIAQWILTHRPYPVVQVGARR
jgi:hypothetical protein